MADQFANILAAAGVKRIYGIVGDSLNGPTDAIRQGKIQWVHVRHEEVAAFAAAAEAHLTGELAVCAGSCGPGNLHLMKGFFDCPQANFLETEVTTATRIAEFMFDKGLAQRPRDIRTWIEGQLYKPQY